MQYCALVNTATPATGLITVGEVLTDRQAAALGEEKLEELVRAGVLRALRSAPAPAPRAEEKTGERNAEPVIDCDAEPAAEEGEEDLPVLEAADDIISDVKSAKRAKRAKRKEETA